MQEPTPEQYNPPLTWRAHAWRSALVVLLAVPVCASTVPPQVRQDVVLLYVDVAVGLVAFGLSFLRRRWPFPVALVTAALGAVSASATAPATLASVSLATRRQVGRIVLVGVVAMAAAQVFWTTQPRDQATPWWVNFAVGLGITAATLVWGMYIGSRRELLWTLRDRVQRAEAEQELRVAQGRSTERARIAREMHDVLAHRISLITMHAGALAYRTDLTADEMRGTAELIQTKSHEALTDLRQVLGVLRDDGATGLLEQPQPTWCDLRALVLEAEESGMRIQYDDLVVEPERMPERVGRTAYRIVQEGLTNARKHAPGAVVLVRLTGSPAAGVDLSVRNPARSSPPDGPVPPGAGLGLVGLGERAKLAGGRLAVRRENGSFELRGWLPWTP